MTDRHEKVTEESRVLGERYNELKERVKAITDEVEQLTSLLKQRQNDLASVQALVVEDPDRCIGELQRLREVQYVNCRTMRTLHRHLFGNQAILDSFMYNVK